MQANINYGKLRIKENTIKIKVPDNNFAKLMYYLQCVFTVIKCNGFSRYTNFENYEEVSCSLEGFNKVLELAEIFNPSVMMRAKAFVINENLGIMNNRFFEITDERLNFHASKEIVIGGIRTRVLKVMFMTSKWLINNYYLPFKKLTELALDDCSESEFESESDNESENRTTCLIF